MSKLPTDERPIIRRSFRLHDTHGLPLGTTLQIARQKGVAVSLPDFYRDACRARWKPEKAVTIVREALIDVGESVAYADRACAWLTGQHEELIR